jgi:hypothetical protein
MAIYREEAAILQEGKNCLLPKEASAFYQGSWDVSSIKGTITTDGRTARLATRAFFKYSGCRKFIHEISPADKATSERWPRE